MYCYPYLPEEESKAQRGLEMCLGNFPGGPLVKTLPSNEGVMDSTSGWGVKSPHASRPKNQRVKQKQY